jgi:hypothetical protein
MNLIDIIADNAAKARKAIMVIHQMPDKGNGSALERLAKLYDLALEISAEHDAEILKHAGQSLFLAFNATRTTATIPVGASLLATAEARGLPCSVAIAYGELAHFETPERGVDYLGAPLERAFALARAAHPGALLVDESVPLAAAMPEVETALGRFAEELLGERFEVSLEDAGGTVNAYEILWSKARVGLRSMPSPTRDASPSVDQSRWVTGVVSSLGSKFGFIVDRAGTPHYFQTRNLARAENLRRGSRVVFRALPPLRGAKERRAEDVFALESEVHGVVSRLNPAGWGFVKIQCDNALEHNLFVLGVNKGLTVGQAVRCLIGVNERGPMGYRLEVVDAEAVATPEAQPTESPKPVPSRPRMRVSETQAIAAD